MVFPNMYIQCQWHPGIRRTAGSSIHATRTILPRYSSPTLCPLRCSEYLPVEAQCAFGGFLCRRSVLSVNSFLTIEKPAAKMAKLNTLAVPSFASVSVTYASTTAKGSNSGGIFFSCLMRWLIVCATPPQSGKVSVSFVLVLTTVFLLLCTVSVFAQPNFRDNHIPWS